MFENRESEWLLANEAAAKAKTKAAIAVSLAYEFLWNIWGYSLNPKISNSVFWVSQDRRSSEVEGRRADSLEGLRSRCSIGRDKT